MKNFRKALLIACLLLTSCSTKLCDSREKTKSFNSNNQPISQKDMDTSNMSKVRVFKPDGSLQCGQGKTISLEEMQRELSGIHVFSSENLTDGKMRIQLCGTPTGKNNVYEILESDLAKAQALGFQVWSR